jgi:hypothetical protein
MIDYSYFWQEFIKHINNVNNKTWRRGAQL